MSTVVPVPLTARNAGLAELHALLRDQHARKVDVPVTAAQIRAVGTHLQLIDTPPVLSEAGVTDSIGLYLPTEICDQGLADKLGIPCRIFGACAPTSPLCTRPTSTPGSRPTTAASCCAGCAVRVTPPGSRGRSCPTATRSSTTWTCSWPPWTA
ncbi:hypothetical protein [Microbispora rosea]|uniref:hypothetical protein n=1 Tax=Microbispora rosea TaxID=58117 RepID=UPI0037B334D1